MEGLMKTAVMTKLKHIEFVNTDIPEITNNQVLVKIKYVGICGSDLHYYESGRIGDFIVQYPFVLGHECSGEVVEVGADVQQLIKGDLVALEPGKTCGQCEACKTGRYNLCEAVEFFATPPYDGVFQEYVAHDADLCFKLPENVSALEGALIEPLAVGFHAAKQGGASVGQTAVVMGAGAIGLVTLLALKAMGLSKVIVVDTLATRLEKAKALGAYGVVEAGVDAVEDTIVELLGGKGPELVIETSGTEVATNQSINMLEKGGTLVVVGYSASGIMQLKMSQAIDKELTFKTVFRYRHIYPLAIDAVSGGLVDLKALVTNIFDFGEIPKAMADSLEHKSDIVKSVIKVS